MAHTTEFGSNACFVATRMPSGVSVIHSIEALTSLVKSLIDWVTKTVGKAKTRGGWQLEESAGESGFIRPIDRGVDPMA